MVQMQHYVETSEGRIPFPHEPHAFQCDVIQTILDCLKKKENIILKSGTGSGKTLIALSSALHHSRCVARIASDGGADEVDAVQHEPKRKTFFVARTLNQTAQIMETVKELISSSPHFDSFTAVELTSRSAVCLNHEVKNVAADKINSACTRCVAGGRCSYAVKKAKGRASIAHFFGADEEGDIEDLCTRSQLPSALSRLEAVQLGLKGTECPVDIVRQKLEESPDIVVLSYSWILNPSLRSTLLSELRGANLIIDECHALSENAQAANSIIFDDLSLVAILQEMAAIDLTAILSFLKKRSGQQSVETAASSQDNMDVSHSVEEDGGLSALADISEELLARVTAVLRNLCSYLRKVAVGASALKVNSVSLQTLRKQHFQAPYLSLDKLSLVDILCSCGIGRKDSQRLYYSVFVPSQEEFELYSLSDLRDDFKIIVAVLHVLATNSFFSFAGREFAHVCIDGMLRNIDILIYPGDNEICLKRMQCLYANVLCRGSDGHSNDWSDDDRLLDYASHLTFKSILIDSAAIVRDLASERIGVNSILLMSGSINAKEYAEEIYTAGDDAIAPGVQRFEVIETSYEPRPEQFRAFIDGTFSVTSNSVLQNRAAISVQLLASIVNIVGVMPRGQGSVVCFPSIEMRQLLLASWQLPSSIELLNSLKDQTEIVLEPIAADTTSADCLIAHKTNCDAGKRSLVLAYARGKVTEGSDLVGNYCRLMIVVGMPLLPLKSAEVVKRKEFLTTRYKSFVHGTKGVTGTAWYNYSGISPSVQALGRVIRNQSDWGAIVFFDSRYLEQSNMASLPPWVQRNVLHLPQIEMVAILSNFYRSKTEE
jgi:Rad3-related DNA helicase